MAPGKGSLGDRKPRRVAAFHVVELLVVVAVVAVLAALMVPVLKNVLEAGNGVKCTANLRELGRASLECFHDQDGKLLPSVFWFRESDASTTLPGYSQAGLAEYLGFTAPFSGPATYRDTILTCPSFKKAFPKLFPTQWNRTYSANKFAHAYDPVLQQAGTANVPYQPGNIRNVRKPSAMWLFMDGAFSASGGFVFTYASPGHLPYASLPHRGKQNAVFMDGHVELIPGEQLNLPQSSDFWGGPN